MHPRLQGSDPASPTTTAPRQEFVYLPFCICLVSRLPYFSVMKDILTSTLPEIESNFETLVRIPRFVPTHTVKFIDVNTTLPAR